MIKNAYAIVMKRGMKDLMSIKGMIQHREDWAGRPQRVATTGKVINGGFMWVYVGLCLANEREILLS